MEKDSTGLPARYVTGDGRVDVARIRAETSIAKVAGDAIALKPSGGELKGLCPFHDEDEPSFFVNDIKGVYHCFGCACGGDVIELHRRLANVDFLQACRDLAGSPAEARAVREDPVLLATRRAEAVRRARELWRQATPAIGSLTETYLLSRAIADAIPGSVRHVLAPRWWYDDGREGRREPAMLAALQDREGRVSAVLRTFLDRDGRKSKRGTARLSLGRVRGSAVRLGPVADTIMLAASVEDGLAVRLMFPGASVWAGVGDGNLPHVRFPAGVRRVVLCGDADAPGRAAVAAAMQAHSAAGLEVEDLCPRAGKDFNEEWLLLHA